MERSESKPLTLSFMKDFFEKQSIKENKARDIGIFVTPDIYEEMRKIMKESSKKRG